MTAIRQKPPASQTRLGSAIKMRGARALQTQGGTKYGKHLAQKTAVFRRHQLYLAIKHLQALVFFQLAIYFPALDAASFCGHGKQ